MATSPADKAQQYIDFALNCLKVAESLPEREDRVVHREMAAEWLKLSQVFTEDAAHDACNRFGNARIRTVS